MAQSLAYSRFQYPGQAAAAQPATGPGGTGGTGGYQARATARSAAILRSFPPELNLIIFEPLFAEIWSQVIRTSCYQFLDFAHVVRATRSWRASFREWRLFVLGRLFATPSRRRLICYRLSVPQVIRVRHEFPGLVGCILSLGDPNDVRALEVTFMLLRNALRPLLADLVWITVWQEDMRQCTSTWDLPIGEALVLDNVENHRDLDYLLFEMAPAGPYGHCHYRWTSMALDFIAHEAFCYARYQCLLILSIFGLLMPLWSVELPAFVFTTFALRVWPARSRIMRDNRVLRIRNLGRASDLPHGFPRHVEVVSPPHALHELFADATLPTGMDELPELLLRRAPDRYQGPDHLRRVQAILAVQITDRIGNDVDATWARPLQARPPFQNTAAFCFRGPEDRGISLRHPSLQHILLRSGMPRLQSIRIEHVDPRPNVSAQALLKWSLDVMNESLRFLVIRCPTDAALTQHDCPRLALLAALPNVELLDITWRCICPAAFSQERRGPPPSRKGEWLLRGIEYNCPLALEPNSTAGSMRSTGRNPFRHPQHILDLQTAARRMFRREDGWDVEMEIVYPGTTQVFQEGLVLRPLRHQMGYVLGARDGRGTTRDLRRDPSARDFPIEESNWQRSVDLDLVPQAAIILLGWLSEFGVWGSNSVPFAPNPPTAPYLHALSLLADVGVGANT